MASCLLEDIPAAGLQEVLWSLDALDFANLRQVNRSICKRTTQNLPGITMQLSDNSLTEQTFQWYKETKAFQHVDLMMIHITGKVPADVFELAMQLLSKRTCVTELRLLGCSKGNSNSRSTAILPKLQSLKHVLPQLKTLVIEGIRVHMPSEVQRLAATAPAAGWQLKCLRINAKWPTDTHLLEFAATMQWLVKLFPKLKHMDIKLPPLASKPLSATKDALANAANSRSDATTQFVQEQIADVAIIAMLANAALHLPCLEVLMIDDVPDVWVPIEPVVCFWRTPSEDSTSGPRSAAVTAAAKAPASMVAPAYAVLQGGVLPSVSAAASVLSTLDDFGCWLQQQQPKLKKLGINTVGSSCTMSWTRRRLQDSNRTASREMRGNPPTRVLSTFSEFSRAALAASPKATWSVCNMLLDASQPTKTNTATVGSILESLSSLLVKQLSYYSSQPAADVMRCISTLELTVCVAALEGDNLKELLGNLRNLKHVQMCLTRNNRDDKHAFPSLAAAISAAATVPGLQTLVIMSPTLDLSLTDNLLLPLTADGGGPGSSLKHLTLLANSLTKAAAESQLCTDTNSSETGDGSEDHNGTDEHAVQHLTADIAAVSIIPLTPCNTDLASPAAGADTVGLDDAEADCTCVFSAASAPDSEAWTAARGGCDSRAVSTEQAVVKGSNNLKSAAKPGSAACPGPSWYTALCELGGLRELTIVQGEHADELLGLPVECLPAGLEQFTGSGLDIFSSVTAGNSARGTRNTSADSNSAHKQYPSEAAHRSQLQKLVLTFCVLSSPSVLASTQLQQLTMEQVLWSGGWAAATAAWPNVTELEWKYESLVLKADFFTASIDEQAAYEYTLDIGGKQMVIVALHKAKDAGVELSPEDVLPVMPFLQEISSGFKHLRSLQLTNLPWLSDAVMDVIKQRVVSIQHITLKVHPAAHCDALDNSALPEHVKDDMYSGLGARYVHGEPEVVERQLQRQFPWATVRVMTW